MHIHEDQKPNDRTSKEPSYALLDLEVKPFNNVTYFLPFSPTPACGGTPLEGITEAHFDKIFSVNVKGLLFTVQKALPLFQDGGSIILTGSGSASKGFGQLGMCTKLTPCAGLLILVAVKFYKQRFRGWFIRHNFPSLIYFIFVDS